MKVHLNSQNKIELYLEGNEAKLLESLLKEVLFGIDISDFKREITCEKETLNLIFEQLSIQKKSSLVLSEGDLTYVKNSILTIIKDFWEPDYSPRLNSTVNEVAEILIGIIRVIEVTRKLKKENDSY